ncbi:xylulokinase [Martelella sp. AD-3]|uniref:xylulokinase n=1 Tax=Martelella sp. AD-3 TaxID=686597 RepID=UPI000463D861|nr:xylulokinase [Martelella sp. AD-3]AMM85439.1 carbohydrate kinase [Martelella sp. AD-3]
MADRSPGASAFGLLGIDLGAGSLKSTLIGLDGAVLAESSAPIRTMSPRPGWSEQAPGEWMEALARTTREIVGRAGNAEIGGVAITAGAHTQVLEDAGGTVIRPAILWNDQRAGAETEELRRQAGADILRIAGNSVNPTWTLPQMLWLKRNEPDAFTRVSRLYLAKDWLRKNLTGTWETDPIDAVGTMMACADGKSWSADLCDMIGWPLHTLPPIRPTLSVCGCVTTQAASLTGLKPGTPVVCGASDTAAETYGAGMLEEGLGVVKLATAATVSLLSRRPRPEATVINYPHIVPDAYYTIAGTNSCASAHAWLRRILTDQRSGGEGSGFGDLDREAAGVRAGAEGLFFHPYLNGERSPHWDPLLRADFVGLGFNHSRGALVRALYEGVAYSLRDCLNAFCALGLNMKAARLIGGGAKSRLWSQIVADVLDIRIELPGNGDASFGAALVAGIGIGAFPDPYAAAQVIGVRDTIMPEPSRAAYYAEGFRTYCDIQKALAPINHRLAELRGLAPG